MMRVYFPLQANALLLGIGLVLLTACETTEPKLPVEVKQEHAIDAALQDCHQQADINMQGMIACELEAHAAWDSLLNQHYRQLMAALPLESQTALRASQRAWLDFRERENAFLDAWLGEKEGTLWNLIYVEKHKAIIRSRALELEQHLKVLDL